jgi:hypothetical protein
MAKNKKETTPEQKNRKTQLKLKKFNLELEELLDKYNYIMDVRMKITSKGIVPQLVVDTPENMAGKTQTQKPSPSEIAKMIKEGKINKENVKNKKVETDGKPVGRPEKKGKKN